jgi:TPR repeat protein
LRRLPSLPLKNISLQGHSNETKNFIDNEVSLDDLCYFPTSIRVKEPLNQDGISATKSHDCENARPCEAQNVENLKSEEKVESLSNKTHGFYFGGLIAVLAILVVAAGSIYKLNGYRQRQQQQEEQQKIVAEQKRVAIEARERASLAQGQAKNAGAAAWAAKEWNSALLEQGNAESAWRRADYVNAKCHYLNVGDLFRKSMEVALARKKQEAGSVKPELRVNAVLLGNNVYGAKINDGVRDHITPIRWTLENGKTYGPYKVTYENNGRKYSGKLDAVKVDWLGVREKSVVLTEDVDFPLIEKKENKSKAIEAFKAKRYDEAYRLFMKSDLEDREVQYLMGHLYGSGHGVLRNEFEAVKWFRKAAEQGHLSAQVFLGMRYANGQGVVKDEYEAIKWFRKAADLGDVFSLYKLGDMYENGRGVLRDIEEAKRWYRKATEKGDQNAKKALERLEGVVVEKPVVYVQPVNTQSKQPELIDRPSNLKYCDNCGHELWRYKKISPRCEKCGTILFKPEETKKNPTGINQGTADSVRTWGSIMSGIGGVL